jgi:hypothetical protein
MGQFISEKQIKEKDGPRGRESAQNKTKRKKKTRSNLVALKLHQRPKEKRRESTGMPKS